jgi:hypothetical protein
MKDSLSIFNRRPQMAEEKRVSQLKYGLVEIQSKEHRKINTATGISGKY